MTIRPRLLFPLTVAALLSACGAATVTPTGSAAGLSTGTASASQTGAPATPSAPATVAPAAALTSEEIAGLTTALTTEYRAQATYQQVVTDLGSVQPFATLVGSETTHVAALTNLFERHGLAVPANTSTADVAHYSSKADACTAGVLLEQGIASQYQQLLATTTQADLRVVYENVLSATTDNHIPALTRC